MTKITFSSKFFRSFKKLPIEIKKIAKEKIGLFQKNMFDPKLKTHKLNGRFKSFWSFSIDYKHRIIFDIEKNNIARFHAIGSHDIYE